MNGSDLYDLVTSLLDGEEISTTLFVTLVNMAKMKRELKRDWQVLKSKSSAMSLSSSTTPSTGFALPTDCLRPLKNTSKSKAIVIVDSNGKKVNSADEILFERQYDHLDTAGYFWVDYSDKTIHFTGNPPVPQSYSAYLFYIKASSPITYVAEGGQGWTPFMNTSSGMDFSPLLAYDVAIMQKGDIDYDGVNARMVSYMGMNVQDLEYAMVKWDDMMKLSALQV